MDLFISIPPLGDRPSPDSSCGVAHSRSFASPRSPLRCFDSAHKAKHVSSPVNVQIRAMKRSFLERVWIVLALRVLQFSTDQGCAGSTILETAEFRRSDGGPPQTYAPMASKQSRDGSRQPAKRTDSRSEVFSRCC